MKAKFLLGIVAAFAVGFIIVAYVTQPSATFVATPTSSSTTQSSSRSAQPATQTTSPSPQPSTQPSGQPAQSGYTMAQVAAHSSASSCWAAINGNVYDLTSWVNQHPGGPGAILSLCGTDGSDAFNGQHGGQRRPASELAQFLLGPLN
jgi:cytochrome b involved in lipid metabolism